MTVIKHHNPDGLHRHPAFSQAVEIPRGASLVLIGGQNGVDETGQVVSNTTAGQTRRALENVRIAVEAAGGTIADIARWRVLLTDPAGAAAGFAEFAKFWDADSAPPAITVEVVAGLANPAFLVEIEATAALSG
jgi:enamine deaminase RidA (YjgF/YER057c/UK114 family)